jgi:Acetyltransferase (GNAT) domain
MIEIFAYKSNYKSLWDDFVSRAKNGSFLFYRDYMEYHADRFLDLSLLFFEDDVLIAVMPANVSGTALHSHEGLTFGGVISNKQMTIELMLDLFSCLITYLDQHQITTLIYKAVPHIYHTVPAEEDLYALFRCGARLIKRDMSSAILIDDPIPFRKGKKKSFRRAKKDGLTVKRTNDFGAFMSIQEEVLRSKYDVQPTHTSSEIASLAQRFPEYIKLFGAYKDEMMLAGIIIYDCKPVVHGQYSASSEIGKKMGATDLLMEFLINEYSSGKKYFDCGRSTEKGGAYLNRGLAAHKEGFGARAITYDTYEVDVAHSNPFHDPPQDRAR